MKVLQASELSVNTVELFEALMDWVPGTLQYIEVGDDGAVMRVVGVTVSPTASYSLTVKVGGDGAAIDAVSL